MREPWVEHPLRAVARQERHSFTDGDWVEAPHVCDNGIRLVQTGNIGVGRFIDRSKKYISQRSFEALGCKEVYPGDLLICRLADPVGRACFAPDFGERMITSVDVTIVRVDQQRFDPGFLCSSINTATFLRKCELVSGGTTRKRISRTNLGQCTLRAPNLLQQQRIAEILSTVDEAIEQTEALIAKTQQIKAGLMHDLFTRGVTADGQLRPPPEEAPQLYKESPLGWIPKTWELKRCLDICSSVIDCKNRTPPATEEGHPAIRTANVRDGEFVWADLAYTDPASYVEWTARGRPVPGDVVITREAPVGEVCMIPDDLDAPCLGQRMMLYRPNPNLVLGSFLVRALQSPRVQKYLDVISGGSTVGHVRVDDIRSLRVPWTTLPEQEVIAAKLDGVRGQLANVKTEAVKLQQIKGGLMHDLLTGRVPVAAATAPDPKEVAANA